MNYSVGIAAVVCSFAVSFLPADPASARIKCKNGYQLVDGSRQATPYCQDNYLAKVAREYGTRVSARGIRNNPNRKREISQFIGQDIRVRNNCATIAPRPRGAF